MSLRAPIVYCIPEETARVAHAAFPKGNPYLRMRDTLGPLFINPEFAALFPKNGQPAKAPAHLALVTIMQFAEGLSDRQAADAVRARTVQEHLAARDLIPAEHIVDTAYVTAEHLVTSRTAHGIDLVGPAPMDPSWQARAGEGYGAAHFVVDWEAEHATCPEGKQIAIWKPLQDRHGHDVISIRWNQAACGGCPVRSNCVSSSRPRALLLRAQAQHEALQAARERQRTELFRTTYNQRAGIEGTISQGTRISDLRRSRYIGETKTRLLHLLIGAALNFVRVAAWLAERPRAQTRRSPFAALGAVPT